MKKVLLIDVMSAVYRAYFAISDLRTSRGFASNAVYGFTQILRKLLGEHSPDFAAAAADSPEPTFRHRRFEEYKAQRPEMPGDLEAQLPYLRRLVEAYRLPWLAVPGWEADDIIAVLARRAEREGNLVLIVSGDKDLLQLVSDRVKVVSPHREGLVYDPEKVRERFGIPPARITDYLALVGDASDNIPGVPGIGPKTAAALLNEHGAIGGILAAAPGLKSRSVGEKLSRYAEQVAETKELIELGKGLELNLSQDDLRCREPDWEKLRAIYRELEFTRLLRDLPPVKVADLGYRFIDRPGEVESWIASIPGKREWAVDAAAAPDDSPLHCELVALALSPASGPGVCVDLRRWSDEDFSFLAAFLRDRDEVKCFHDSKTARHRLRARGLELEGVAWDTVLAAYLLDPSRSDYGMESLAWDYLRRSFPSSPPDAASLFDRDDERTLFCARTDLVRELRKELSGRLRSHGLDELFQQMELPLARVLAGMERTGIAVDRSVLAKMSGELERDLLQLADRMYSLAGERFNLNSPRQLSRILFEKLGLPPQKKIKTGQSTDFGVLKKLAPLHPLPEKLLDYRQLFKLKSTYIDPLPSLIDPADGRLHTTFNQTVTATGRLSSSRPNLQNIPIRSALGKRIRSAFIPSPSGWKFLSADYSQIDLRILAHLSGDELLRKAFANDEDIHAFTASQIFNLPPEEVTPEMRRRAKTVNFGVIYGMEAWGLSEDLGISQAEARRFIETYFQRYLGVAAYIRRLIDRARKDGYVTTIFGRRRYLPELESGQDSIRRFGERTAVNTPIQGSSADVIKLAMVSIDRRLRAEGRRARMLLQIHDELLFEAPAEELDSLGEMVKEEMEGVAELEVGLKIDLKRGDNWGEL